MQSPLSEKLQLIDLTQAPLMNIQEDVKKKETEVMAALDQLHKEYQSVKTLLSRYTISLFLCLLFVCCFVCGRCLLGWW